MPRAASSVGVGRFPTPTLLAPCGITACTYVTLTGTLARLLVLCSSPRIFDEERDCSQSIFSTKFESTETGTVTQRINRTLLVHGLLPKKPCNVNTIFFTFVLSLATYHISCFSRSESESCNVREFHGRLNTFLAYLLFSSNPTRIQTNKTKRKYILNIHNIVRIQ